ncbi:MAG: glutamate synthase subunit beta [Pseudomonadota bacterium]
MGKTTGFKEIPRKDHKHLPVAERIRHYQEFTIPLSNTDLQDQGARCMDCGIPFCHEGCPVDNLIPDWNDLVYQDDWQTAADVLHSTNNFPEFTGKICPAPCQAACTLNITDEPVTIKTIEDAIAAKAWEQGWIQPQPAAQQTGKKVAIVGSGPAGLAAAQQLARAGHQVSVYEREDQIGGLLRYGIPDFKMDKALIDRRLAQMSAEGVTFHTNAHIGVTIPVSQLQAEYDAILLAGGAELPRDMPLPGRDLEGVHFAMDFLVTNNKVVQGVSETRTIDATDKHVIVIGGGDTGSDCIGTANRQGAAKITQLAHSDQPPLQEDKGLTWPEWPHKLRTSTSQEEGCERLWNVSTTAFIGDEQGRVKAIRCVLVRLDKNDRGQWVKTPVPDSEFEIKADLVLLAIGFSGPVQMSLLEQLQLQQDGCGSVQATTEGEQAYQTSTSGIFTAGDMRRGQSLVVWAIREGRQAAHAIDRELMGQTDLPR